MHTKVVNNPKKGVWGDTPPQQLLRDGACGVLSSVPSRGLSALLCPLPAPSLSLTPSQKVTKMHTLTQSWGEEAKWQLATFSCSSHLATNLARDQGSNREGRTFPSTPPWLHLCCVISSAGISGLGHSTAAETWLYPNKANTINAFKLILKPL